MERNLVTLRFFETYYYTNVIHNILAEPFAYLRPLNEWYEDNEGSLFLQTFPKWSLLHSFSAFVIDQLVDEQVNDINLDTVVNDRKADLWVDEALRHHEFKTEGFRAWLKDQKVPIRNATEDHIAEYHQELRLAGDLENLLEALANEAFYVLFSNRTVLSRLNGFVAGIVKLVGQDGFEPEFNHLLASDGIVKRAPIPGWARRAVFYRDRGLCTQCQADTSGLISIQVDDHFDHVIPLKQGGINDVTNLQLLCGACNRKKGPRIVPTSLRYESWY